MNFVGNKVICVCVQVRVSCAGDTYLSYPESYWRQTLVSLLREICCCATSHLPLGVYQRRARNHYHHLAHQARFLAPLPGTPSAKIGELHTTLYLCFFSLVSLPFSFFLCVLYQKSQKKNLPHLLLLWVPLKTPSCVTSLVTTTKTLFAPPLPRLPLQLPLMKLNLPC